MRRAWLLSSVLGLALLGAVSEPSYAFALASSATRGASSAPVALAHSRHIVMPRGTALGHPQWRQGNANPVQRPGPQLRMVVGPAAPAAPQPVSALATAAPATPTPAAPTALASFQGPAQSAAISQFGVDQKLAPPDSNLAVSPANVVVATNSTLTVYDRAGALLSYGDFNSFVGTGWATTDPKVVYDSTVNTFYLTLVAFDTSSTSCSNVVLLLRSNPGDPTNWSGFQLTTNDDPFLGSGQVAFADQPKLGFSNNVLGVTWTYFGCSGGAVSGASFGQLDIVQKADLLGLNLNQNSVVAFVGGPIGDQIAVSLGSTSVQYVLYNGEAYAGTATACAGNSLGVFAVTGQPAQQNVHVPAAACVANAGTQTQGNGTTLPAPQSGTSQTLDTGDDRLLSAVWQSGALWTGSGTDCTPAGDSVARSCINVVDISADAGGSVGGDTQYKAGINGQYLFYPSVSVDSNGSAVVVYDQSSSTTLESVQVAGIVSGTLTFPSSALHTSASFYNPGGGECNGTVCRWGDYSGAAQDPAHPTDVWVVSEDTENTMTANCAAHQCWNAFVGRYTFSAPSISSLSTTAGPTTGGQTVLVTGSDFLPGSTSATMGGSSAALSAVTPDSFTIASTPTGAAGLTHVVPTTLLGSGTATMASAYVYAPLSQYISLAQPVRIVDTRAPYCRQCGSGSLNTGEIRNFQVTGLAAVPANATSVVINVTACGSGDAGCNGSTNTYMSVYPAGTARPSTSSINAPAGSNIANLVTVAVGDDGSNHQVSVFNNSGPVDLIIDVEGYYIAPNTSSLEFHPEAPVRVCDTRQAAGPVCNVGSGSNGSAQPIGAGQTMFVALSPGSTNAIASGATAAIVNLTAIQPTVSTYLTVFPATGGGCGTPPAASNLNVAADNIEPNRVQIGIDATTFGICVFNANGSVNIAVDVNGWFAHPPVTPATYSYQATGPVRVCDTRPANLTQCSGMSLGTWSTITPTVSSIGGLPGATTMKALAGNVTAVSGSTSTYLAIYADRTTYPGTSDLNAPPGVNIANMVVVAVPADGKEDVTNASATIDFILDVSGWFQ